MTKSNWSLMFGSLVATAVLLAPTSSAQTQRAPILEKVAKTYGVDSWDKIESLRYTFTAEIPGVFKVSRTWEWEPKTTQVTYEGQDKEGKPVKVTYKRSELSSQPDNVKNEVEPGFVNDNYWALFPFHAYWDTGATAIDQGTFNLPQGGGTAELVPIKYPTDTGYTPGDTWNLYIGKDNRVVYLDYHRGGAKPPSRVFATWTGYKKAGPLLFATEHRGSADGKPFHLVFSDVAVKLTGSDTWIKAQ